jgi:hypothetical protein
MYELHNLGWSNFQRLCLTIAREILGQTVDSFLDSNDGGRDGAFAGTCKMTGGEALSGRFVIQCKFTTRGGRPRHLLREPLAYTIRVRSVSELRLHSISMEESDGTCKEERRPHERPEQSPQGSRQESGASVCRREAQSSGGRTEAEEHGGHHSLPAAAGRTLPRLPTRRHEPSLQTLWSLVFPTRRVLTPELA